MSAAGAGSACMIWAVCVRSRVSASRSSSTWAWPGGASSGVVAPLLVLTSTELDIGSGRREREGEIYARIWPEPRTTYFVVVTSARPIGPRACRRDVEFAISAPKPNSPPSVKRVDAFT